MILQWIFYHKQYGTISMESKRKKRRYLFLAKESLNYIQDFSNKIIENWFQYLNQSIKKQPICNSFPFSTLILTICRKFESTRQLILILRLAWMHWCLQWLNRRSSSSLFLNYNRDLKYPIAHSHPNESVFEEGTSNQVFNCFFVQICSPTLSTLYGQHLLHFQGLIVVPCPLHTSVWKSFHSSPTHLSHLDQHHPQSNYRHSPIAPMPFA